MGDTKARKKEGRKKGQVIWHVSESLTRFTIMLKFNELKGVIYGTSKMLEFNTVIDRVSTPHLLDEVKTFDFDTFLNGSS